MASRNFSKLTHLMIQIHTFCIFLANPHPTMDAIPYFSSYSRNQIPHFSFKIKYLQLSDHVQKNTSWPLEIRSRWLTWKNLISTWESPVHSCDLSSIATSDHGDALLFDGYQIYFSLFLFRQQHCCYYGYTER